MLGCMLGIAAVLFALPWVDVARVGWIVLLLILALTTLSATQDVAIDSYSVGLVRRGEEGADNGARPYSDIGDGEKVSRGPPLKGGPRRNAGSHGA